MILLCATGTITLRSISPWLRPDGPEASFACAFYLDTLTLPRCVSDGEEAWSGKVLITDHDLVARGRATAYAPCVLFHRIDPPVPLAGSESAWLLSKGARLAPFWARRVQADGSKSRFRWPTVRQGGAKRNASLMGLVKSHSKCSHGR